jgi:nucleoside-diphosphate-sugar epimerase
VTLPYRGNREAILKINTEGTRNLLEASARSGVQRFVFVSSVAVYGDVRDELVREDHPLSPHDPYSESKILAERWVREYQEKQALQTVILRPCVIYGPRDHNFLPKISKSLAGRHFPLVDGGRQPLDMVYVTDVAEALILAGHKKQATGQTYNVTDGERHSIRELIELFGKTLHKPLRPLSVPYPLAYGFASLSYWWNRLIHPGEEPLISPAGVRAMTRPHHYDISKIRSELGYKPQVSLQEGLKWTVDWYLGLK